MSTTETRGRPALPPSLVRSQSIRLRVTLDEKTRLERAAAARGESVSDLLRRMALREADKLDRR